MPTKKSPPEKLSPSAQVAAYMQQLEHPLKAEIEAVRAIIKGADSRIAERIKWNAPSYYTDADLLTFNPRATDKVHLVFHHPAIVRIDSSLLEGDYKDRRMMYFRSMKEVLERQQELERIIQEYVQLASKDL